MINVEKEINEEAKLDFFEEFEKDRTAMLSCPVEEIFNTLISVEC